MPSKSQKIYAPYGGGSRYYYTISISATELALKDENKEKIEAFLKLQAKRVMNGVPAADVLKETGAFQVSLIQEKIKNGSYEENKEATIKRKGSDKPLIDTGRMRQSVHYVIEKKGNRKE